MNSRKHALTIFLSIGVILVLSLCLWLPGRTVLAYPPGEESSSGVAAEDARLTQALLAEGKGTVTQHYGFGPLRGWQGHILIAAAEGTEILAAREGTVAFVGEIGPESGWARVPLGYGLVLRHENGLFSVYACCEPTPMDVGQQITAGQTVASVKKPEAEKEGPYFLFRLQDEENAQLPPILLLEDHYLRK